MYYVVNFLSLRANKINDEVFRITIKLTMLLEALDAMRFEECTPIQEQAIPVYSKVET